MAATAGTQRRSPFMGVLAVALLALAWPLCGRASAGTHASAPGLRVEAVRFSTHTIAVGGEVDVSFDIRNLRPRAQAHVRVAPAFAPPNPYDLDPRKRLRGHVLVASSWTQEVDLPARGLARVEFRLKAMLAGSNLVGVLLMSQSREPLGVLRLGLVTVRARGVSG